MVMGSNPGHLLKYIFHFSLVIYVALDIASYFTNKNSAQIHTLSALIKRTAWMTTKICKNLIFNETEKSPEIFKNLIFSETQN